MKLFVATSTSDRTMFKYSPIVAQEATGRCNPPPPPPGRDVIGFMVMDYVQIVSQMLSVTAGGGREGGAGDRVGTVTQGALGEIHSFAGSHRAGCSSSLHRAANRACSTQ